LVEGRAGILRKRNTDASIGVFVDLGAPITHTELRGRILGESRIVEVRVLCVDGEYHRWTIRRHILLDVLVDLEPPPE
jgi:hypothetical protein